MKRLKGKINNKGFTLIELLAVITIMGILMGMSISAYSLIVNNQRKQIYANDALTYINNARADVINGTYEVFDHDTTYYIHVNNLSEREGLIQSAFGASYKGAYAVIITDKDSINRYYWVSTDQGGWTIDLSQEKNINRKSVYNDASRTINNRQPIGRRTKIVIWDENGQRTEAEPYLEMTLAEAEECYGVAELSETEVMISNYKASCGTNLVVPAIIDGKKVTEIGTYTFYNKGIKKVILPNTIKKISDCAFQNNQLTSVKIPEGVITIGGEAFGGNKITDLTLPNSLTSIGAGAFRNNRLTEAVVPDNVTTLGSCSYCQNPIPNPSFLYVKSGNTVDYSRVRGYIGDLTEFTGKKFIIPSENEGVALKKIEPSAFSSMSLSGWEVVLPESVEVIGSSAFSASGIAKINLNSSNLKTIDYNAFYNNRLTQLNLSSSITYIGYMAFNNNATSDAEAFVYGRTSSGIDYSNLVSYAGAKRADIVIPTRVNGTDLKTIGGSAFKYCYLSGSIKIPSTVTTIGSSAFSLNSISKVDNGDGVWVDGFVFARNADGSIDYSNILTYANSYSDVVVPDTVKTISPAAFYYTYIRSVQMPEGLKTIGSSAFDICALSGTVVIPSTVETIGANAFRKEILWSSFNGNLTKIVNKTGRVFDWKSITKGSAAATFETGIAKNLYGNIEIVKE